MSIANEITRLQTAKANIKTSLENKGAIVPTETKLNNYPSIIDNLPSGGGRDWSEIGYSSEPELIQDGFDYAKNIKDNWNSSVTTLSKKFFKDNNLIYMPLVDTSNVTNFTSIFSECYSLVEVPLLNTSNVTQIAGGFFKCSSLKKLPLLDLSKVQTFGNTFFGCSSLNELPAFNTESLANMGSAFSGCMSLKTFPAINTSKVTEISQTFNGCSSLQTIPELNFEKVNNASYAFGGCTALTNLGGFKNLGQNYPTTAARNGYLYKVDLSASNNLTHDSLMNVINKVYDIAGKGVAAQNLTIGSTNIAKLTAEEIAIATNKGWTIS